MQNVKRPLNGINFHLNTTHLSPKPFFSLFSSASSKHPSVAEELFLFHQVSFACWMNKRWMIILCKFSIFCPRRIFAAYNCSRFFVVVFSPSNWWMFGAKNRKVSEEMQMNLAHRRELHKLGILRSRSGKRKRVWVQVTARKFNFSVPTFSFSPSLWLTKVFDRIFLLPWEFLPSFDLLLERTRIFVFAQRNALKKLSSVVLCQVFSYSAECVWFRKYLPLLIRRCFI